MKRVWKVKPRKFVRTKRGVIVGNPGDLLPEDDPDALACPSSVVLIADPRVVDHVEAPVVEDIPPFISDETFDDED